MSRGLRGALEARPGNPWPLLLGAAAALAAAVAVALLYQRLAPLLPLEALRPRHRVAMFGFIPVIADTGSIVEASLAVAAGGLAFHLVYARRLVRMLDMLEEELTEFLAVYSSVAASSTSSYDALKRSSELIKEPLSSRLLHMAELYRATGSIDEAYGVVARVLPRRARLLARAAVVLARSGGQPARVLSSVAAYAREMRRLTSLIQGRLAEYKMVVALAALTYAVAAGVVIALIAAMRGLQVPGGGTVAIDTGLLLGLYYYSLLAITAASSIVIARVINGYTLLAPKYMALLLLASTAAMLASSALIRPGVAPQPQPRPPGPG